MSLVKLFQTQFLLSFLATGNCKYGKDTTDKKEYCMYYVFCNV